MSGREFDVQVLHTAPDSPRGQLLQQYVLARVMSMVGIDLALYDYDRHNSLYYFAVSPEEEIYFRYGGRDSESQDTYLNLSSLELALQTGLEMHEACPRGELPAMKRPEPKFPRDIPGMNEAVVRKGHCVECHHIAHFETMAAEENGTLDKVRQMYRSPDIRTIGIHLDIPRGLRIDTVEGSAEAAGLRGGDIIRKINEHPVVTFGDFQYFYDQVDRDANSIEVTVEREGDELTVPIFFPHLWWVTDLVHRYWTVEPLIYFEATPLTIEEKKIRGFREDGFASTVSKVAFDAMLHSAHELEEGDIIHSVNGVETDLLTKENLVVHIKLRHRSGERLTLGVIRDGKEMELPLNTIRKVFRRKE
ncbi:MAG: Trx7/PDZ domain-containing (seleno)protein [Verrucomicrobiota bacterium]